MLYPLFIKQINSHRPDSRRIVLALSGGLDSRILLHLLGQFQKANPDFQCVAVHVHHGLSPHADEWAALCQRWSVQENIPCYVEKVQIEQKSRTSLEQQARALRYQALASHVGEGDLLLTAQHADDQLETFLLALKRGSGPAGLASMPLYTSFAKGGHLRPLLPVSRQQIFQYAQAEQLEWVEDESNQDTRYDRNFLRHQICPPMIERWPGVRKAVARSAALCGEQQALLEELLQSRLEQAVAADHSLAISALTDGSVQLAFQLIRQWLATFTVLMPSQAQLNEIWHSVVLAQEGANPQLCWSNNQVRRYKNRLYLVRQFSDVSAWQAELTLGVRASLPDALGSLALVEAPKTGQLRLPLAGEKVTVRFEPEGLEAKPLGRQGKRKLKKLFQEYGVPSWNRRRTPLVFYGDQLAAVAGLFVCEAFSGKECDLAWHY